MLHRRSLLLALLLLVLLALCLSACRRPGNQTKTPAVQWSSPRAPYTLALPAGWQPFSPEMLENGADFSAHLDDRIMMVLATPLPPSPLTPDVPDSPHLERYVSESLAQLERDVQGLELLEQRDAKIGEHEAVILTANGSVNQRKSRYMIAYTGVPGWRLQLVAWAHHSNASTLSQDFDDILSAWQITTPGSPATTPNAGHLLKGD